jgi:hypothetical protein
MSSTLSLFRKYLLLLGVFFFIPSAFAAVSAGYVQVNALFGGMLTPNQNPAGSPSSKPYHTMGDVGYGLGFGYLFNTNQTKLPSHYQLGVEGNYQEYPSNDYGYNGASGSRKGSLYTYSGRSIDFMAILNYDLNRQWELTGKAGVGRFVQSMATPGTDLTKTFYLPALAVAAKYSLSKRFQLALGYDYFMGKSIPLGDNSQPVSIQAWDVGLIYNL